MLSRVTKLLLIALVLFFFNTPVLATATSNSVVTKVGNPTGPAPTPAGPPIPPGDNSNSIVATAEQIAARLKQGGKGVNGPWYSYDPSEPNVFYWCDYMVIDSWASAGVDIQRPATDVGLGYYGWLSLLHQPGFQFLPGNTPVNEIQPGDMVLMLESTGGYHVALVGAINVVNGNGEIQTYDSNSWDVTDEIDVVDGVTVSRTHNIGNSHISGFGVPPQ